MGAIAGVIARFQTMADGSIRLWLDLPETVDPADLPWLTRKGQWVGVAPLRDDAHQSPAEARWGEHAKALRLSGFTRSPAVWSAVGSDAEFLDWLKTQPCAAAGRLSIPCSGDVVPAHVRRVATGAGTGIKPEYSAIALCSSHHQLQHNRGEEVFGGGKDWFDEQRVKHLERWCWETLKARLGYAHWNEVPPALLKQWAIEHDVVQYLPEIYRSE